MNGTDWFEHMPSQKQTTLVKFGGELLEKPRRLRRIAKTLAEYSSKTPIVVVHGGGREVDSEIEKLGIPKRVVDGLRVTDQSTLEVVLGVLAGRINARLVAAIGAAGGSAVGLTGADAGISRVRRARRYRAVDGSMIDLGYVGVPDSNSKPRLIADLNQRGHIPVVASIGSDALGRLYNVNADTFAGDLAVRIRASRLLIAGTTAGVLDQSGRTIPTINEDVLMGLIEQKLAIGGMVAKLLACRVARAGGVKEVAIVDGRRSTFLDSKKGTSLTAVKSSLNPGRTLNHSG